MEQSNRDAFVRNSRSEELRKKLKLDGRDQFGHLLNGEQISDVERMAEEC